MEIMLFEDQFNEKEAQSLCEAISDICDVSMSYKSRNFVQKNKSILESICIKIQEYKSNKAFFEEWGIYDKKIDLNKSEMEKLIEVLRVVLDIHPESQLHTYVGLNKNDIISLIEKCKVFLENLEA